jgi:hypothetical protein
LHPNVFEWPPARFAANPFVSYVVDAGWRMVTIRGCAYLIHSAGPLPRQGGRLLSDVFFGF